MAGGLAASLVLAGVALRCWQIDFSFDADEVFSIHLAMLPFGQMLAGAMADTPHPPLHIILLHFWSMLFGGSEIAARSLSVALSAAFLLASWHLLRRFLDYRMALGALALLALSPLFVLYGQLARPYSLIALLAALNLLAFVRFIDANAPRDAGLRFPGLLWALSSAALLYAQYMGILLIGVELMYGLLVTPSRARQVIGHAALGCVSIVPWALLAMGRSLAGHEDPLPQVDWMTAPASTDFAWFYVSIFGESQLLRVRWLLALAALVAALVIRRALRQRIAPEHVLFVALAFAPPLLVYLLSVVGDKPLFASRQLLGSALAFVVVTGLCLAALPRVARYVSLAALLIWSASSVHHAFPERIKPPWRDIAAYVEARYPGQRTLAEDWWIEVPFDHYRKGNIVALGSLHGASLDGPALLLCRTPRCAPTLEAHDLQSRARHVHQWNWGTGQLDLYEIARLPAVADPRLPDGVALQPHVVRTDPESASPPRDASL